MNSSGGARSTRPPIPRRLSGWSMQWSATTWTARRPRSCRRWVIGPASSRAILDAIAGFGPLQPYFDDPVGRGDLDQRAGPRVRRAPRPLRADHADPDRGRGRGTGRADAAHHRAARRPVHPVRRRDAARRQPAARGHPVHHPPAHGGQHSQVRPRAELTRRTGLGRLDHRARRAVPRGVGRGRAEHPRRRRHAERQDHDAERVVRRHPGTRTGRHRRGGLRAAAQRAGRRWRCRPGSPTWRAAARSRCGAWSKKRCGCARPGSSSARCVRRSAWTC